MEFKTLLKSDKSIRSYLTGDFSVDKIALPVRPLHSATTDKLTFKIVEKKSIQVPGQIQFFTSLLRLDLFGLTALPFLAAHLVIGGWESFVGDTYFFQVFLAMFFLHASVFMFNDYFDHIKGGDRANSSAGSQVIQRGWIRAKQVYRWAILCFIFAALMSLPVLIHRFDQLWPVAVFVAVAVIGYSAAGKGFKYRGAGDIFVFLCLGPLIFYGASRLLSNPLSFSGVLISVCFGGLGMFYQQTKNFKNIYMDSMHGVGTFISRIGFDWSKRILIFQHITLNLFIVFTMYYSFGLGAAALSVVLLLVSVPFFNLLAGIDSPLSGDMRRLPRLALSQHYMFSVLIIFSTVIKLWIV